MTLELGAYVKGSPGTRKGRVIVPQLLLPPQGALEPDQSQAYQGSFS